MTILGHLQQDILPCCSCLEVFMIQMIHKLHPPMSLNCHSRVVPVSAVPLEITLGLGSADVKGRASRAERNTVVVVAVMMRRNNDYLQAPLGGGRHKMLSQA